MRMRKVLMSLVVVLLAGCASASTSGRPVAYERQELGAFLNFVGNWDDAKHPVLYAVIRTPEDYDRIYHPAGVMGADRPYAPKPEFFLKSQILLVCRLVPKLSQKQFVTERVEEAGNELTVYYRYSGPTRAPRGNAAMFKQDFALYVPKKEYTRVRFIENGALLGVLELAAGQWTVPPVSPVKK